MSRLSIAPILFAGLMVCGIGMGCSGKKSGPEQKPVYKVTGSITVDGNIPDPPIQIECHSIDSLEDLNRTFSSAQSKKDGTFALETYKEGDGIPAGDYSLTFSWRKFDLIRRQHSDIDLLKNRYADPLKSETKFTVDEKPTDLGEIQLKTK